MTNLIGIYKGNNSFKWLFKHALFLFFIIILFLYSYLNVLAQNVPPQIQNGSNINYSPTTGGPYSGPGPVPNGQGANVPYTPQIGLNGGQTINQVTGTTPASDAAIAQDVGTSESVGATPDGVLGFIHTYVLTGIGWVVGQAGKAFDYAISEFIVGFGRLYITGTGETIDALWGTVRDIFNLTFIFGLVYIGFKMILDSSDSNARKMLVSLIGAALLVNFSLFITKFVIDFSNIAATQVYNAFESSGQLSITNGFMTVMGVTSMMTYEYTAGGSFAYVIGMLLVFSVLAYVFLAGAIMIIIRFVALNIYMVFSPFMFLGWVFPALQGYSRDYWSGFLRQAFFAPAFIFMLYLSYQVASTFPTQRNLGNMFNPNGSTVSDAPGLIPYFALVIVFLCASMIVAKKMGAHGSTMAISVGNKIRGNAQSFIGRNTIGRPASWMAKNQDTRGGRIAGGLMTAASLGTFNNRAQRELYEAGKKAKFGGSYSRSDDKDYSEKVSSLISNDNTKALNKKSIAEGKAALLIPESERTDAHNDAIYKMQSVVAGMSTAQIESMTDKDRISIASAFTAAQAENLMKSDKIGIDDKTAIGKARKEAIEKLVTKNEQLISSELTKLTVEQIEDAGADFIRKYAGVFSAGQVDDLKKSKKLSPSQKTNFTSERSKFLNQAVSDATTSSTVFNTYTGKDGKDAYKRRKASDVAGLGRDVLLNNNALDHLTIGDLEAIGDKKTLEREDRDELRTKIESAAKSGNSNAQKLNTWFKTPQASRLNW